MNSSNIVRRAGGVEGTVADLVAYPAERVGEVVINGQVHSEYSPRPIPCGTNPLWKASQLFAELENYYLEVVSGGSELVVYIARLISHGHPRSS